MRSVWVAALCAVALPARAASDDPTARDPVERSFGGLAIGRSTTYSNELPLRLPRDIVVDSNRAPQNQPPQSQPAPLRRPPKGDLTRDPTPATESKPVELLLTPIDPPLGFTGPSGVLPTESQESDHFVPIEDRWRLGFPEWDRYAKPDSPRDNYPYVLGHWCDPYNQNVLKGDFPILGQHTFFNVTLTEQMLFEQRQVPTPTTPFESTGGSGQREFFGDPNQFFFTNIQRLSFNLIHGDAAFKPVDWQVKITPVFNQNYLDVNELAIVRPDVRRGTTRARGDFALEEWFVESKITDLSPNYDFLSVRAGSQPFLSDFRGFIFNDTNRGVRLFGNRDANRDQFNIVWFDQAEKDTNSELNTFRDRHQNVVVANYYRQDFIWPGYTAQVSFHYNHDEPSFHFDDNDFLVRPDPAGVFQPHELNVYYLGWAGDGHIGRTNISHAFYWALGQDELNPIAGQFQHINAQTAAVELSYDRDWARFRTSFFWASGDGNPTDHIARGFDSIFDAPNFAGGEFSYWQRQAIKLFGVNLVNRGSLVPDLRSSKTEGQSNFVNPGLGLFNVGFDADITPKLRSVTNCNFLWFDKTAVLEQFVFQDHISRSIGVDLSTGIEYRPLLNNNVIITAGISTLLPGAGFRDLYNSLGDTVDPLVAGFMELVFQY